MLGNKRRNSPPDLEDRGREVEDVTYINGVPAVCPGCGDRILPDTEEISVDLASDIQLCLLCGIRNPSGILPGLYYRDDLCCRKAVGEGGRKKKEEKDPCRMSSSELRNAVGLKIYGFCDG